MLHRKYGIKNFWHLTAVWFALWIGSGLVAVRIGFIVIDIRRNKPVEPSAYVLTVISVAIYLFIVWVWRKATFRRNDFIKLAESTGVKFTRTSFYDTPGEVIVPYRFADGFLDDIYVVARMDVPWFAFSPFPRDVPPGGRDYSKPDYMKEESIVALFSLVNGPFNINAILKIEGDKRDIPVTGCPEIDKVLKENLAIATYFHAKLIFNTDCLELSIIGGSWEGRNFGEKIMMGFILFNKLNNELKSKYPVMNWTNRQVKWSRKDELFYLQPKGE